VKTAWKLTKLNQISLSTFLQQQIIFIQLLRSFYIIHYKYIPTSEDITAVMATVDPYDAENATLYAGINTLTPSQLGVFLSAATNHFATSQTAIRIS
jgi:hypothetical protein